MATRVLAAAAAVVLLLAHATVVAAESETTLASFYDTANMMMASWRDNIGVSDRDIVTVTFPEPHTPSASRLRRHLAEHFDIWTVRSPAECTFGRIGAAQMPAGPVLLTPCPSCPSALC